MSDFFFTKLPPTVTCMKRWGLRASTLSAVTKADAGQNASNNYLTPNVLYMMLCVRAFFKSEINVFENISAPVAFRCEEL